MHISLPHLCCSNFVCRIIYVTVIIVKFNLSLKLYLPPVVPTSSCIVIFTYALSESIQLHLTSRHITTQCVAPSVLVAVTVIKIPAG